MGPLPFQFSFTDWISRMGVWILDGVVYHRHLLEFALKKETLQNTLVAIVVDLSRPWAVMEALEKWTDVINSHIRSLKVSLEDMAKMESECVCVCVCVCEREREREGGWVSVFVLWE